ncbi:MAG: hypothetical protein JXA66_06910 [Oligoflexia bacterium]|nr:hypothetical protein [Oligoflexia bacterium]
MGKTAVIFIVFSLSAAVMAADIVDKMVDYVPFLDDLVTNVEPRKVSNPMLNQYFDEYRKGAHVSYNYFYSGYTYQHNIEHDCFTGAAYCYFITSKYYTYKNLDRHDYRYYMAGFTPFYADYAESGRTVVFDDAPDRRWKARPALYREKGTIIFSEVN